MNNISPFLYFTVILFDLMIFGCAAITSIIGIVMAFIAPNWTPWQ